MMTDRDTFRFVVQVGLRKCLGAVRLRRSLSTEDERRIAVAIVQEPEMHNCKIILGEPGRPPG